MIGKKIKYFVGMGLLFGVISASGQTVILDEQVRAGDLILFPAVSNKNKYYYVADKAHLAETNTGKPQFSFLRYVRTDVAEEENEDGQGGGIVHAVVELKVSEDQLRDARSKLRRINSSGTIVGPVTFQSGTFALISSFAEEGSDFTTKVLGVGNAPILEGHSAAISLSLTRKGAQVLWESFNTATPDISFSFNMEMEGYRSPKRALLEADFSKIYSNNRFSAALATPILQAEIDLEFEKLRTEGAIKLTQIGDDEDLDALIRTAYDHLTNLLFDRAESSGQGAFTGISQSGDSVLDRASGLLASGREEARTENDKARERNTERADNRAKAAETSARVTERQQQVDEAENGATALTERAQSARSAAAQLREDAGNEEDESRRAEMESLASQLEAQAERYEGLATTRTSDAVTARAELVQEEGTAAEAQSRADESSVDDDEEIQDLPSLAIVASYRMKRVEQSGKYRIDLNKYSAGSLSLRFDENIGDLTRELSNPEIFKTANIGDSAFRQREIAVMVDGLNDEDFRGYVNFITVLLRKRHENGESSTDEIRIDRNNFSSNANNFKLAYLKLDDHNQDLWLDYEYKVRWSFAGGVEVEDEWVQSSSSGIPLYPPYERRVIYLDGDPDTIDELGVRSVEFTLYSMQGNREKQQRVSLRPRDEEGLSRQLSFIAPEGSYDYDYKLSWRLPAGERIATERISSADSTIYFDEIPGR